MATENQLALRICPKPVSSDFVLVRRFTELSMGEGVDGLITLGAPY